MAGVATQPAFPLPFNKPIKSREIQEQRSDALSSIQGRPFLLVGMGSRGFPSKNPRDFLQDGRGEIWEFLGGWSGNGMGRLRSEDETED